MTKNTHKRYFDQKRNWENYGVKLEFKRGAYYPWIVRYDDGSYRSYQFRFDAEETLNLDILDAIL